jgi:multiple sugar transport system substrate-binding protein
MADRRARGTVTRRQVVKTAAASAVGAGLGPLVLTSTSRAQPRTLKILQWSHFVPGYDKWFDDTYTRKWGEKNNIRVQVDHIANTEIPARAAAEVAAQQGHDLFMFLSPPAAYETQVIDHTEIVQEVEKKHGKMLDLALKSTFNPKTKAYFGFSDSYVPDPGNYRKDLWDDVGVFPDTWDDVLNGGRKIKQKTGIPVGIGLSQELDSNMALRAVLWSFGGAVQDEQGRVVINSKPTIEALKYMRALFKETMTPEVFTWDPSSNNRFILAGRGSFVCNAISVTRTAEKTNPEMSEKIQIARTPRGPARRIAAEHVMDVYVIWKFAENKEPAKKFLVDYIDNFREGFLASEFYNFPCFQKTVPDLVKLVSNDPKGKPADKYKVLADVTEWATNVGYPGYATAPIDEVFNTFIVPTMFAKVALGQMSPEEGAKNAEGEIKRIFDKWKS